MAAAPGASSRAKTWLRFNESGAGSGVGQGTLTPPGPAGSATLPGMGSAWQRGARVAPVAAAALLIACSQGKSPAASHPGDDLTVDVEASTYPPTPDAGNYADGYFAALDAPYGSGYGMADVYSVL